MKKVFFSALVAVVAVGGAFTTANAVNLYALGSSTPITCTPSPSILCQAAFGGATQAYLLPASNPSGQGSPVNTTNYTRP